MVAHVLCTDGLPLLSRTAPAWAAQVLCDPLALLADHAYLERKAASNALDLINRWPHVDCPGDWVCILAAVARDETTHLHAVSRLLVTRGGQLPRTHRNPYATALHTLVRRGQGAFELLDRLLVSALIEARSCERFDLLTVACRDRELAEFYRGLLASERSHYQVFLHLAAEVATPAVGAARWQALLQAEAAIIAAQAPGPRMHSGVAP